MEGGHGQAALDPAGLVASVLRSVQAETGDRAEDREAWAVATGQQKSAAALRKLGSPDRSRFDAKVYRIRQTLRKRLLELGLLRPDEETGDS